MPHRTISRIVWAWQLWRIRRQQSSSSLALIAQIDKARAKHKPVSHLQQQLTRRVHQELRQ